ncbi:hypothetical protein SO802_013040 [Lithocarpus litseifolius]|uniref:Uncharacterized protein n=1 Tax=Lithocarpus litseifolius TaxID=425828 RepID=A0AAW2D5X5_9ROSI
MLQQSITINATTINTDTIFSFNPCLPPRITPPSPATLSFFFSMNHSTKQNPLLSSTPSSSSLKHSTPVFASWASCDTHETSPRWDVLTVEIEHVDVATMEMLEQQGVDCQPKALTIRIIQIDDLEGAKRAGEIFGCPLMKRLAYEGCRNAVAHSEEELSSAVAALG